MRIFALLSTFILFSSQTQASEAPSMNVVKEAVRKFSVNFKNRPFQVVWNLRNTPEGFLVACPVGKVCPDKKNELVYEARNFQNENDIKASWVRLFFEQNDFKNLNLNSLRENFSFASFEVDYSQYLSFPGYLITFSESGERGIIKKSQRQGWSIDSVNNGVLTGRLTKIITAVSIARVDEWASKNCDLMIKPRPQGCWAEIKLNIPLELRFSLPLETKQLDCLDVTNDHPRCYL